MRLVIATAAYALLFSAAQPHAVLSDDGAAGVIVDRQGTALVRPVGRERWTPLTTRDVLAPGDMVRTPVRGANAVEIRLRASGKLTLGPGSLIELTDRSHVHLFRGDVEIDGGDGGVSVQAPGKYVAKIKEPHVLRTDGKSTTTLAKPPRWLTGYRASTTDEWMGSLVANVDGRNVPLAVGYHKVNVDIRDQIARTTIEESFINTTSSTLEGVFYFPLPADASISGFGMWIGDELVEADIVEKQRARAIYEDILRRRKDPGLLEWSGGNLFKARVFPIFGHSEKRIRIRYTQVLPLEGSKLRYRYALRSEMLTRHPLRQLRLDVSVSSKMAIEDIGSPTHEVRVRKTAHSARVEFDAEEYAPDRDFELSIDVARGHGLTAVPHRRGDDGYFMLLLSPPDASQGQWNRELMPEGKPLDVLVIADTSGSMDGPARAKQSQFVSALLSLLSAKDRFRLMTADVHVDWFRDQPVAPSEDNVASALAFLDRRDSLGWTDLDFAFSEAIRNAGARTVIVYVGDGIGTTGDADPVALANRFELAGKSAMRKGPIVCHAVSTSSKFEKRVLDGIARVGGGSVRAVGSDPAAAAYQLLAEAAQPVVKGLEVEFEGLTTARVYPEVLPNLAAGRQQIVLGRFLPTGGRQSGKIIVKGSLEGKPVRYATTLTLAEDETGNAFVPRLWARSHLEALLSQGRTQAVKDEIVAFSEEFGIMTPYTSFLVLESDADREFYGVTRRVKMRDGEQFFAAGRDAASVELMRKQMKAARTWRLGLRARMLREIATLGKHLHTIGFGAVTYPSGLKDSLGGGRYSSLRHEGLAKRARWEQQASIDSLAPPEDEERLDADDANRLESDAFADQKPMNEPVADPGAGAPQPSPVVAPGDRAGFTMGRGLEARKEAGALRNGPFNLEMLVRGQARYRQQGAYPFSMFHFPVMPNPPVQATTADNHWPKRVVELLRSLDRRASLDAFAGGVELRQTMTTLHALRGYETSRYLARGLYGSGTWFARLRYGAGEPIDHWFAHNQRGIASSALGLGRVRDAVDLDRSGWPFPIQDRSLTDLVRGYSRYTATVEETEESGVATVVLRARKPSKYEIRWAIDVKRRVLLEQAVIVDGKQISKQRFADFVKAAGSWWATKSTLTDKDGKLTQRVESTVTELPSERFAAAMKRALADHDDAILLAKEDPTLDAAKQAVHERKAGFAEQFRIATHYLTTQQWDKVWAAWAEAEKHVSGKPGAKWLAADLLTRARKGKEVVALIDDLAAGLLHQDDDGTDFLLQYVLGLASRVYQANERLVLLDRLHPAFARKGPDRAARELAWIRLKAQYLQSAARSPEAVALLKQILTARPFDLSALTQYLYALDRRGDRGEAIRVARHALETQRWNAYEANQLYQGLTNRMWQARNLEGLLAICEAWIALDGTDEAGYQRYLGTLAVLGRAKDADAWIARQLTGAIPTKDHPGARARLGAAINHATGSRWNSWSSEVPEKWWKPLIATALRLIRLGDLSSVYLASRITGNSHLRATDEYREFQTQLLADLAKSGAVESMELPVLGQYVSWIPWGRTQVDGATWRRITDRVRARWAKAPKAERDQLAGYVLQLLRGHGESAEVLEFTRARLEHALASDDYVDSRSYRANDLLQQLVRQKWTEAIEAEILNLLPMLQPQNAAVEVRNRVASAAVRWISDQLLRVRYEALMGPAAEREKLARRQLALRRRSARRQARVALIAKFEKPLPSDHPFAGLYRPWFELERLCFAAQLGKDLRAIDGETRELMLSVSGKTSFERLLQERCAYVLAYLATRRKASKQLVDGVVEFFVHQVAKAGDTRPPAYEYPAIDWKQHVFRLLIAADRPEQLIPLLRAWIEPAKVESRWAIALGYLEAERGKLAAAIETFESVARNNELGAREYAAMADWLLALGETERREAVLLARYRVTPENQLAQRVSSEYYKLSRRGNDVPANLDPDVLRVMHVLFEKATYPANYLGYVQNLYRTIKDFRLLESLPRGVVGHTPQSIYPFLQRVGNLLRQVHEEATCDSLARVLAEVISTAKRDVDRRAVRLLVAMVERRAAEVLNQSGPHMNKGLTALREAWKGDWQEGEPELMAAYLASLGRIPQQVFADEQLQQLEKLLAMHESGTLARLNTSLHLARTLWAYGKYSRAIDRVTVALDEYRKPRKGFPPELQSGMSTLVRWLRQRKHYRIAERHLEQGLAANPNVQQRNWLRQQLFSLYVQALRDRVALSIGGGRKLYESARKRMLDSLWNDERNQAYSTLSMFCNLHTTAATRAGVGSAGADLERFAYSDLPELLTMVSTNAPYMVNTVAGSLCALRGRIAALKFLITRLESEPAELAESNQGGWQHYVSSIAQWRHEARTIGELEPRLLKLVVREIERDLVKMRARNRSIYSRGAYFWSERRAAFAAVAKRVIARYPDSPARLVYAASYLWSGLDMRALAIDTLLAAERRGQLHEKGRTTLVYWLHTQKRWRESLPILEKLVAMRPDTLEYRRLSILSLHMVARDADAITMLDKTEQRLHEQKRWREHELQVLARVTRQCKFFARAVTYYEELIPLHQRTHKNRGVGNGVLSAYYGELSQCYVALGKVDEAVDAASAAIVSWGRNHNNRASALAALKNVITRIPDLDGYVARLGKRVAETGLDAPVIRKALGLVYLQRHEPTKAVEQLLAARELGGNDAEIHRALVQAYDAAGAPQKACEALLAATRTSPMNLQNYVELGRRLARLGDERRAERAWTTLVEVQPNEAESHRLLAEHRERQKRFDAAILHWRQVIRIRTDEPAGWLSLARAQIAGGREAEARETLQKVLSTRWEQRFGNVHLQASRLLRRAAPGK